MKIKVLGSGGSEGIPVPFCRCQICQNARGEDVRLRGSYWLKTSDTNFLIEASPDLRQQIVTNNLGSLPLDYLFLSHRHFDHIYGLAELRQCLCKSHHHGRSSPIGCFLFGKELHSWLSLRGTESWYHQSIQQSFNDLVKGGVFTRAVLESFKKVEIGERIQFTLISGPHTTSTNSSGFVLKSGGKSLAYLGDIAVITPPLEELFIKTRPDLLIAHCPFFFTHPHRKEMDVLKLKHIAAKRILISHFSHNAQMRHEDMVGEAARIDSRFIVAYDGLEIEL